MKKGKKLLAFLLSVTMICSNVSVSAAPKNDYWQTRQDFMKNMWNQKNTKDEQKEDFEKPEEEDTSKDSEQIMTLIEDSSTVENGEMLRASTYEVTTIDEKSEEEDSIVDAEETTDSTIVKYFPVTMYDYNTEAINAATDKLDDDLIVREGFYFSNGTLSAVWNTEVDYSEFVEGDYYIQNIRASEHGVGSWIYNYSDNGENCIKATEDKNEATLWHLKVENGIFYLKSDDKYLYVGTNGHTDCLTTNEISIDILPYSGNSEGVQLSQTISQKKYYLCQWGGEKKIDYGGYDIYDDAGNGMRFYAVDSDGNVSETPTTLKYTRTLTSGYAAWNHWNKASGDNANGDLIYTGLVGDMLLDDQIVFNVNEGGVFSDDTTVKNIYEYVGLPFVLDDEGYYTFDSDANSAYFADTDGDGKSDPKSGTKDEIYNLYFEKGKTQPLNINVGDGSKNAWFPYNIYDTASEAYTDSINYHFGMRADLPFSMTANGCVKSTDDSSAPIKFSFSGDDDVWVYIDGRLVIDLGGIHNRLDVIIDFAANTVTYSENNGADNDKNTGSYNDTDFAVTQKLFTDSEGTGLIDMSREAFAAIELHEMSVFYLERGEGTSNCKIQFNLPMHDTVLVTKDATKSWNETTADQDNNDDGVDPLTDAEQEIVNNINFGFTLYKKDANDAEFTPVSNTNFYVTGAESGETLSISNTDESGHFYLKNGQTAKFITNIPNTGITYYVVEDQVPDGFVTPDFNYAGESAGGYTWYESGEDQNPSQTVSKGNEIPEQEIPVNADSNTSYVVTVYGSVEANDSIEFICSNYLNAELPNPSAFAMEDMIVIDYGLPVQIDPLANDIFRGDSIEIMYVGGDNVELNTWEDDQGIIQATWTEDDEIKFGKIQKNDQDNNAGSNTTITRETWTYTLTKPLTEVEVLTYIVKVTGSKEQEVTGKKLEQYAYSVGKIYIIPATTMYYEENFSNLVTFEGAGWKDPIEEPQYKSEYQEPGVVGTIDDSTYGSDVAYLNDSHDSNGTSCYGETTEKAIRFSYTFTGTGTSFFARTSAETGYMQVKLYKGDKAEGSYMNLLYRDTYYEDTNNTDADEGGVLYNIPVYTQRDLDYGTYTVVVTVAKKGTPAAGGASGSGGKFYLDGIRIIEPLNMGNDTVIDENTGETITDKAMSAYRIDGKENMQMITLREKMLTDAEVGTTPWNFVVLTDTDGEIKTAEEYASFGPKEEIYLQKDQSISFSLKYWQTNGVKLYVGMKAPFGAANVQAGQSSYTLNNAADCYYDITEKYTSLVTKYEQATDEDGNLLYKDEDGKEIYEDAATGELMYVDTKEKVEEGKNVIPVDDKDCPYYQVTFTLTATDSIVSLTNIKVTGEYEFTLVDEKDIYQDDADTEETDTEKEMEGNEGWKMKKVYSKPLIEIEVYELNTGIAANCTSKVTFGPEAAGYDVCEEFSNAFDYYAVKNTGSSFYEDGSANCDCYYSSSGKGYFTS